jgi:hypothetical protein
MRAFAEYVGWRPDGTSRSEPCGDTSVLAIRYARNLL